MRRLLDIYRAQFNASMLDFLQYRLSLILYALARIVEPVVYLVVWSTVSQSQGDQVGDYQTGELTAYFIGVMFVNHMTFAKMLWRYELRIQHGMLSSLLLHPVFVFHRDVAGNLASKVIQAFVVFPTTLILIVLFRPTFQLEVWTLPLFVVAVVLAWMLNMVVDYIVALSAFWFVRTSAIDNLFYLTLFFFSGRLAPLDLLPPVFQAISWLLPFRFILWFPTETLIGRLSLSEVLQGLVIQILWIAVGSLILRVVWRWGVHRYSAVGG